MQTTPVDSRSLHYSPEAEQSVLGALMLSQDAYYAVSGIIRADDFAIAKHRCIFGHIQKLHIAGKNIDVLTVYESMHESGDATDTSELAYLGEMASNTASCGNARRYAELVREKSLLRRMIEAGQKVIELATTANGTSIVEKAAVAEKLLSEITEQATTNEPVTIVDAAGEFMEYMQDVHAGKVKRMTTGLTDLDKHLYDLQPGALVVIAGRPGMGKTSLAMQIAIHVGENFGNVLFCSMEMPKKQIAARAISIISKVPLTRFTEKLSDHDDTRVAFALRELLKANISIDDTGGMFVSEIQAKARKMHRKIGLKMVVIDYLQLMGGDGPNENLRISAITRDLKAMAKNLDCPVVLLSQLNREVEKRSNKRPVPSDLRDSGAIEQDADLIIFPYRDEQYNKDSSDKGTAEIIIGKQRNGPTSDVRVAWIGELASFEDLDHESWSRHQAEIAAQREKEKLGQQKLDQQKKGFRL